MSSLREQIGGWTLFVVAMGVVATGLAFFALVAWEGAGVLSLDFLLRPPRAGMTEGGIAPAILGSFLVSAITAVVAVPLGVGAAIWLHEIAGDGLLVRIVRLSIRNLSGVPSIVYGLFGVALFVHAANLGLSMLASGLTLGLLTLPWTITASEEALKTVPRAWREGALALGATRWETLWTVVLPAATPGMITGAILGLARAAGETAPILFTGVTFYTPGLPRSLFDQFMALPYHLYVLATQHHDLDAVRPLAWGTSLVLLVLVGGLTGIAALWRARLRARART